MDNSHTVAAGSSVGLEYGRKPCLGSPFSELVEVCDHLGLGSTDARFPGQIDKDRSRIDSRKIVRRTEGALNQSANRLSLLSAPPFLVIKVVQMIRGQVIAGNNEIRLGRCDRIAERTQRYQTLIGVGLTHCVHGGERMSRRTDGIHG